MRSWTVPMAILLSATLLAGCASSGGKDKEPAAEDFKDLDLQASATTGILRGVVVDDAVRPIPNVAITLSGGKGNTSTTSDGLFGFDGLEPGPYFVKATKPGFKDAQTSADVVAGVDDPPIVKLLMTADNSTAPYIAQYVFDGFIECSFSLVAVGFAACNSVSSLNDRFSETYPLDRLPDWAQSEMVWESTQAVSPGLDLVYSVPGINTTLYTNYAEDRGVSPLTVQANKTTMDEYGALEQGLIFRVFNEPVEGTRPNDPVNNDDCVDRPQLGGCATGVGMTIEQSFKVYTNVFYGFTPDPAWRFTVDGPHPLPT